ncbi:hypothetical protein DCAR_0310970 [Daucus carota subsp. sativus]|uniref:Wound-responsive family protein n=1 Tax=Daucus carota subsp. sativus TaxID=79200 RepID=A0A162AHG7_DAUCS|nr:PREDICTED: uncharacterized protein LOC108213201 [Daucus carota subsp. sativus]WOG91720.1 hypothetical protein DCAR_0310970 [Daucus carota subsp. sativus]
MSAASKAWIVAASVGLVEALKDQGFARWNYPIRCLHQRAKANLPSFSHAKMLSSSTHEPVLGRLLNSSQDKAKQSEESLRKFMYLSCWAPN